MVNPTRIAAVLVGAALLVCPIGHGAALAQAGAAASGTDDAALLAPPASEAESRPSPRAYLFRGALGPIFSRGMDRLTDKLEQAGIKASVWEFTICRFVADQAIRDYRESPAPIVLIGHSMGGLCALTFAEILQEQKIPVSLVVTVDPAHASPKVPLNVERFINIFLSNSILGGGDIKAETGYHGHYASFDMKQHEEVTHINIDKLDYVHTQLVAMISQLPKVPAATELNPVPLRYLVPADATLELWDSGAPLTVRTSEPLKKVAADYHLPLWSLTQANRLPENALVSTAQQIVIPRHLLPPPIVVPPPPLQALVKR